MLGPEKSRTLDRSIFVSLEGLVPSDHFYRRLDAQLDLNFVRDWVKDCYAEGGFWAPLHASTAARTGRALSPMARRPSARHRIR
jgi:hypothetical protein